MTAKLYKFNNAREQHNLFFAVDLLRNAIADADEAGRTQRAEYLSGALDRLTEALDVSGAWGRPYTIHVAYPTWRTLHNAAEWAKAHRAGLCEAAGVPYVE